MKKKLKILILETVPKDAELMEHELYKNKISFISIKIENKKDFLKKLRDFGPDVILSGYPLSEFLGLEALEIVKKNTPEIPFILVTSSSNEKFAIECVKKGAWDYVIKEHIDRLGNFVINASKLKTVNHKNKLAEKALQESEEKFKNFVETSTNLAFQLNKTGYIDYISPKVEKLFGFKPDELIGKHLRTTTGVKEFPKAKKALNIILSGKPIRDFEINQKDKSGRIIPVAINAVPVYQKGKVAGLQGTVIDITEHKQAEKTLKESRRKLSRIAKEWKETFDAIDSPIALINNEMEIIRCNRAQKELFKMEFPEIIGCKINKLIHNETQSPGCYLSEIKKIKKRKSSISKINNSWYQCILDPILSNSGKTEGAVHLLHDITDRIESETKILEQQEFIQTAINAVTHPFYIIDVKTLEIILKNKASLIFSQNNESKCYNITHGRNTPCNGLSHPCPVNEIVKTKKPTMLEHVHSDINGKKSIVEMYGFPIFDEDGNVIQIIEYCLDISERKKAEKNVLKQQKELLRVDKLVSLGILVSGVAHEINNPNNSILLNSQFLTKVWEDIIPILDRSIKNDPFIKVGGIKYEKLKQKMPNLLLGISESSKRIKSIVEDLKRFAKKDFQSKKSQIDINSVVKSAVNLMSGFIKKSTNNFELQLEGTLPEIEVNFQKIEQVMINIIQNSCQAVTPKSDHIKISTEKDPEGNNILIKIKDKGIGINPKDLKLITEPFFTTKRESGGTGLGLSVSDKIIVDHNGKLLFKSKQGEGTTVEIYLPISRNNND